jgi:hypothetical protein
MAQWQCRKKKAGLLPQCSSLKQLVRIPAGRPDISAVSAAAPEAQKTHHRNVAFQIKRIF